MVKVEHLFCVLESILSHTEHAEDVCHWIQQNANVPVNWRHILESLLCAPALQKEQSSFAFSWKLIINQLCEGYWCEWGWGAKINPWKNHFLLFFPLSPAYPPPTSISEPSNPNPFLHLFFLPFKPLNLPLTLLQKKRGKKKHVGKGGIKQSKQWLSNSSLNSQSLAQYWLTQRSYGHKKEGRKGSGKVEGRKRGETKHLFRTY